MYLYKNWRCQTDLIINGIFLQIYGSQMGSQKVLTLPGITSSREAREARTCMILFFSSTN
jgi:hypothetical protein